jgi:hypothetical protein
LGFINENYTVGDSPTVSVKKKKTRCYSYENKNNLSCRNNRARSNAQSAIGDLFHLRSNAQSAIGDLFDLSSGPKEHLATIRY